MKFITSLFLLVIIFGLPTAEQVSKTQFYSRELGLPNDWTVQFVDNLPNCGNYKGKFLRIINGCTHYDTKTIELRNDTSFDETWNGNKTGYFDRILIHEIGHALGNPNHDTALDRFIYFNLLKYQPVFYSS